MNNCQRFEMLYLQKLTTPSVFSSKTKDFTLELIEFR
jgi:hypothetical protein